MRDIERWVERGEARDTDGWVRQRSDEKDRWIRESSDERHREVG